LLRRLPLLLASSTLAALLCASATTSADVTSWLSVGGGATAQLAQGASTPDYGAAITYSLGVGTSPHNPFVLGVMYRGATYVTLGTDVGWAVRGATGGFARGDWGLALDLGAAWRPWGNGDYGTFPLQAVLTGGSPWGFQLGIGAQAWNIGSGPQAEGLFAVLEIDLLRLTVDRQGPTERWWPNPNPAGGHEKTVGFLF
jgi:hypothetical protein